MIDKEKVSIELAAIVSDFNDRFDKWMQATGCRATFGWKYGLHQQIKAMEIQAVDFIVYRKPPPAFSTLGDAMKEGKKE